MIRDMTANDFPCNFRPLLSWSKTSLLYRSSNPDSAEEATVLKWLYEYRIRTIIDLRNISEIQQYITNKSPVSLCYPLETLSNAASGNFGDSTCVSRRINITFTNWKYKMKVFFSFPTKLKVVVSYLFIRSLFSRDASDVERYGAKYYFNQLSQWQMYASFIELGKDSVRDIFALLLQRNLYGILINCHAGKDRTGVISALLMDLLGYDRQQIVDEYSKSEVLLQPIQDEVDQSFINRDLDPVIFGKSPATTMEEFLDYFYEKYNDTSTYLQHLGFTCQDIDRIKSNLINNE